MTTRRSSSSPAPLAYSTLADALQRELDALELRRADLTAAIAALSSLDARTYGTNGGPHK